MSDLTDRVVLVTGATDGHGRALATEVAARGATVAVHGRDRDRLESTLGEIRERTGSDRLHGHLADLAELAQVRRLAEEVRAGHDRLHVLVNNAGIGARVDGDESRLESPDGIELRFAVNYLAGYLLTHELLPLLRRSAPARVVNVSSAGQSAIDFTDPMLTRGYDGGRAYTQSKLAQVMFTFDLAEELAGTGVSVTALHPATYMPTKMVPTPMSSLEEGVEATLRLVADPGLADTTGEYFNGTRPARAEGQAYDADARRALRDLSERLVAEHA